MIVDWQIIVFTIPVMVFAGMVHGALGLGFPLVATPIIAIFLDVKLAILLTLLPTATVNVASIYSNGSLVTAVKKYWVLAVTCLIGAIAGAAVIAVVDASPFRLLLAALILLFLWVGQSDKLPRAWCIANPVLALLVTGLIGGFSAGTTNVMVAILLIYFISMQIPRPEMVSAMNLCFLLGKLAQIGIFFSAGLLGAGFILSTVPLAITALASLMYGQHIGKNISQEKYRQLLKILLAVLAFILVWQFFAGR